MKLTSVALLSFLLVAPATARRRTELDSNPISRVVSLLLGLQQKLSLEVDKEEQLFSDYKCWYTQVKDAKTASNAAAASRISTLESYISDIDAGKIEFTTERADLTKQVAGLHSDLETAKALRDKEQADFEAAQDELQKGISALTEAIATLEGREEGSLLSRSSLQTNAGRQNVLTALALGRSLLNGRDAKFLEHVLHGDVPNPDWKKLNRKATFKDTYAKRSGGIVATLKKVKLTFTTNLADATAGEEKAASSYEALKTSKEAMLEKAEAALSALVEENGARGMSKEESQAEIDDLKDQVAADTGFIQTVESDFVAKEGEYNARKELRGKEVAAISEAIQVLHSDEARDSFKKSYSSQGYLFLQEGNVVRGRSAARAAHTLRLLAASTRDARLGEVLTRFASGDWKTNVNAQIDSLVATLQAEESTDLANKETCEKDRADAVQQARTLSQTIDDHTDDIARAEDKVKELDAQIKEQEGLKVELAKTKEELTRQRENEAAHAAATKQEDVNAVALIEEAMRIIKGMQEEVHGAVLSQLGHRGAPRELHKAQHLAAIAARQQHGQRAEHRLAHTGRARRALDAFHAAGGREPMEVEAGVAPPPPPATWEEPTYAGAAGESAGVMSLLTLIKEDIESDIASADSAEAEAITAHEKQVGENEAADAAADEAISSLNGERAGHESARTESDTQRTDTKTQLAATMDQIKSMAPGCDYLLVNFQIRSSKRQTEIDGLQKAKAIIQGANFS